MITSANSLSAIPHFFNRAITEGASLYRKIEPMIYPNFAAVCGTFYCGYGAIELLQSQTNSQTQRITAVSQKTLSNSNEFLDLHGTLMMATGISSILEALNGFGVINYGELSNFICGAGSAFFLYANIFALEENIRAYQGLKAIELENAVLDQNKHNWQKFSAVWGIMSNIGYITATSALLFSAPTAIALTIGVVAAFSGGLKIVSDFMVWHQQNEPSPLKN